MKKLLTGCLFIFFFSGNPPYQAKTQVKSDTISIPVVTAKAEIREQKDSILNGLNELSKRIENKKPKVEYRTRWRVRTDTVYIVLPDSSAFDNGEYKPEIESEIDTTCEKGDTVFIEKIVKPKFRDLFKRQNSRNAKPNH